MRYKDMFTVLVVDSRIKRSRSLNDAFERILGNLRDVHHLRTDLIGTTEDAIVRLRNDASIACVLLEWGRKGAGIDGAVIGMRTFGASAPLTTLAAEFGFTPDAVVRAARDRIAAVAADQARRG